MSIEGVIVSLALVTVSALLVTRPLITGGRTKRVQNDDMLQKQRERLLMYYERVLTNLRDLDEDHVTGKMPDADYVNEREMWAQRGVEVLKALDTLSDHSLIDVNQKDAAAADEALDAAIEQAIEQQRRRRYAQGS
jgi:hypothetical protein